MCNGAHDPAQRGSGSRVPISSQRCALSRRTVGVPPFAACPEWFSNMQRLTGSRCMANRAAARSSLRQMSVGKNQLATLCTFLVISQFEDLDASGHASKCRISKALFCFRIRFAVAVLALAVQGRPLDTLFGLDHDCDNAYGAASWTLAGGC
jgi:hypothetical protein